MRATRDEKAWLERRLSMQKLMDKEADDAVSHLNELNADIDTKTANHDRLLHED